jgi:hypothetical protein
MNAIVNPDEVRKAVVDSLSSPSEDIARHVLSMAGANPSQIEKAITTGTGLVAYDLQAPAKNLDEIKHSLRGLEKRHADASAGAVRGRRGASG